MHACTRTWRHGECIHAGSLNEQGVPRTTVTTAPTHLSRPYTSHVHVQCSAIMVPRGCDLFYMLDSRARARHRPTCWYQHAPVPSTAPRLPTPHGKPRINEITFLRFLRRSLVPFCSRSEDTSIMNFLFFFFFLLPFLSLRSEGNVIYLSLFLARSLARSVILLL